MRLNWKSVKNFIVLLCLPGLVGCSAPQDLDKNEVTVCLVQGDPFVARRYVVKGERGDDLTFQLSLREDYTLGDCSYEDYSFTQKENDCTIVLHNVRYSCRISVSCFVPRSTVVYDYNGGTADGETFEKISYKKSVHPRINTQTAEHLKKDGYVLTGWNTSDDGKGEHVGLGSRVTLHEGEETILYAEWRKETDLSAFSYEVIENEITLLKYLGSDTEELVLPSTIGGREVTTVASGFAKDRTISTLVFPKTVEVIEENAFFNTQIQDIYFFDTMISVSDASFSGQVPHTWHINAQMIPRYQGMSDITVFADKMDLLMQNADKRKLIFFAGCSMFYGLDSQMVAEEYPDYTVLDMGVVGGTNASFQFDCMLPFIREGDVFVHAPEQASSYQLMANLACENRVFIATEGNFDLLTLTDMAKMEGAFDCFSAFNSNRRKLEPRSYDDAFSFNEYGDNTSNRPNVRNDKQLTENYGVYDGYVTETSLNVLCNLYDQIEEKGGTVYFSYAPINELCVVEENAIAFTEKIENGLKERGYTVISDLRDYVMPAKYFYDTDYHLTNEGAQIRTNKLISDLKQVL